MQTFQQNTYYNERLVATLFPYAPFMTKMGNVFILLGLKFKMNGANN